MPVAQTESTQSATLALGSVHQMTALVQLDVPLELGREYALAVSVQTERKEEVSCQS
jgi:hypothetical protein